MPDFDLGDVTGIITPQTVVAVVLGGLLLAIYLWSSLPRVSPGTVLRIYFCGLAFLAIMGAGRWADLSPHWEAWIGSAVLWSLFLGVAWLAIGAWRFQRRRRTPTVWRSQP